MRTPTTASPTLSGRRGRVQPLLVGAVAATMLGLVTSGLTPTATAAPASEARAAAGVRSAYTNPVSSSFADTFADPSVIRGLDGSWYAYGTSDPLTADGPAHRIPIARSSDLSHWEYVGDAFSDANLPSWLDDTVSGKDDPVGSVWAPDIRYVDGQYRMYYVVTETTVTGENGDNAVGMATAPTPVGPWTDSGAPVVGPRRGSSKAPGDFLWTFDPSVVTGGDGRQWMFYGSYYGGISVTRLSADGRRAVGGATRVAVDNKFEGAYPVHHGSYWYLFASTANCCAGPTTGYSVQVGRSHSVKGPYLDAQGVPLDASRAGGTPTLVQNGNRWIGTGHNAVLTDLAGRDFIVYHGIDRAQPFLSGTDGINQRPMLMDRLDWVDGWPAVRAGRGPSERPQRGATTAGRGVTDFAHGVPAAFRRTGRWAAERDTQSGRLVTARRTGTLTTRAPAGSRVRVEADLRSTGKRYGLQVTLGTSTLRARVEPGRDRLTLEQSRGGRVVATTHQPLPAGTASTWHAVALEVRGGRATATVSPARLGDPVAVAALTLRSPGTPRRAGAFASGAGVDVDNLSVVRAAARVTELAPDRVPSTLDRSASDEFTGSTLRPGWSWVREDEAATVAGDRLTWPTELADLNGPGSDAGVLLRSPGSGPWTVQTKVSLDVGVDQVLNYAQAGLVAYIGDDQFARLSSVAIWNTRQTEFGHEMPWPDEDGVQNGGTIVGPPAATTWLRLTHRVDRATGEHELRAWTSRDGHDWVKGGVWTLPAGSDVRVGLVSQGRTTDVATTARFDYFRLYR